MRHLVDILEQPDQEHPLVPPPTVAMLDDLIAQMRAAGLHVDLAIEGQPRPLAPGVELSAYRIVQEALTNVLKHAGPAQAQVHVRYARDLLEVEVTDDGRGGGNGALGAGRGLVGMRERVALYGGQFRARARVEGGFVVQARLPVEPAPA
jgi:signal transduction histidine kinase